MSAKKKMKVACFLFTLLTLWGTCSGVLYSVNDTVYRQMPALYSLDDYQDCMSNPEALYCLVDAVLHSDEPSELMNLIQNYSDYTIKHFNHTQIHRGVCVKETCRKYVDGKELDFEIDRETALNACLNDSMWKGYKLHIKSLDILYCDRHKESKQIDSLDVFMAVIYVILIASNIFGTYYDFKLRNRKKKGNPYLLSFSLFRNWTKLTAPGGDGPDPRFKRLNIFNGLRAMTIICVYFSHTVLVMAHSYVQNPLYIEQAYEDPLKQILFNGSLVTFTFFTMSSFLLAYNLQIYTEKHEISWWQLPKGILLRWLRLTPTYALVIGTVCTWMRHLGDGPLWKQVVVSETTACRQYWWAHLLYINNYVYDDPFCFPQSWYLAADTQLFCVGLFICVIARSPRARKVVLGCVFAISLAIPAIQTYLQDLDATVIQTPESYRSVYKNDATFQTLYASGHGNLATYIMGLSGGFLVYSLQKNGFNINKYKRYRWAYWLTFPMGVAIILSGGLFYIDGERAHLGYRMLYATIYKPAFQCLVIFLIIGVVFKLENAYRGVLEWRGWTWLGRVSYDGFLLHTLFQRGLVGSQRHPTYLTDFYVVMILSGSIFLTFICAAILWLLVESPMCQLTKLFVNPPSRNSKTHKNLQLNGVDSDTTQSKL